MRLVDSKHLIAFAFALLLAACQSTPDTTDSESVVDQGVEEESTAEPETSAGTFGTGERSAIDGSGSQSAADARLLSNKLFYFDFDQAKIRSEAFESLKAHARYLINNANARVRLEGHADERGTREYNVALGERRGNAVAKFLRLSGVSGAQMEVISYGEEKPVSLGHSESAWAKNRRVELDYVSVAPN